MLSDLRPQGKGGLGREREAKERKTQKHRFSSELKSTRSNVNLKCKWPKVKGDRVWG